MFRSLPRALGATALALLFVGAPGVGVPSLALEGDAVPGVVNVNTATAEELMALPGIGEARARAILELRESRGRFRSLDELVEVKGIGSAALERLRPRLTLTGPTTLGTD